MRPSARSSGASSMRTRRCARSRARPSIAARAAPAARLDAIGCTRRRRGRHVYKVIWLVKFRSDKPRDEVVRWWREEHGPLAAKTPGMERYVQNLWTEPLDQRSQRPTSGAPHFDGHAEHWFTDFAAYEAAMTSDEWKQ